MIDEPSIKDNLTTSEWKVTIDKDVLEDLQRRSKSEDISQSIINICLDREKKTQSSYPSG